MLYCRKFTHTHTSRDNRCAITMCVLCTKSLCCQHYMCCRQSQQILKSFEWHYIAKFKYLLKWSKYGMAWSQFHLTCNIHYSNCIRYKFSWLHDKKYFDRNVARIKTIRDLWMFSKYFFSLNKRLHGKLLWDMANSEHSYLLFSSSCRNTFKKILDGWR